MNFSDSNLLMCHPPWFLQTLADLKRHEGFREYSYPDPLSRLGTVWRKENWGNEPARNILARIGQSFKDGFPWTVGYGFTKGVTVDTRMNVFQSDRKLEALLTEVAVDLTKLIPQWKDMPEFAQTVLLNMCYNLGSFKLSKFDPTLQLFKDGKYAAAGERLANSLWYRQVGARGKELVGRLVAGRIEPEHLITTQGVS